MLNKRITVAMYYTRTQLEKDHSIAEDAVITDVLFKALKREEKLTVAESKFICRKLDSTQHITKPETMFRIIADQIRSPDELLVIRGFFDHCKGRLIVDKNSLPDDDGFISTKTERADVPEGIIYCEGRKAMVKGEDIPATCERTGLNFWWCHNSKCYGSCISSHDEWQEYTLLDFLQIGYIKFKEADYEVLLGYVNKVNKFLEHMKCRSCSQIIKPMRGDNTRNYGFYRVSNFACTKEGCEHLNEEIYLTHCINGFCSGVVDSRDAVKCKNPEHPETQGWYICNDCFACCNTQGIEKRRYIFDRTGQNFHGATEGHRDRGLICCPKCGNEMNNESSNAEDYRRVLDWFIGHRHTSSFIVSSGQRTDGKYWFKVQAPVWDQERLKSFKKKLYKYVAIGFNVPDIKQEKDNYLVAEPFHAPLSSVTRVLSCPSCEHQINLVSVFDHYLAIKKYHTHIDMPPISN